MQIAYKDRIANETIRQMTQQIPVSNRIRLMQLNGFWAGVTDEGRQTH